MPTGDPRRAEFDPRGAPKRLDIGHYGSVMFERSFAEDEAGWDLADAGIDASE